MPSRLPLIDALKALAALCVFANHLTSYGPLAEAIHALFPALATWLFEYGRMAVQVFLVIAGFLSARALAPEGRSLVLQPLLLISRRYLRLVLPYLAALSLAMAAAALASHWLDDEAIPGPASLAQWLAHALLLHNLLGYDALSAGVWYIAIDFQLFALMTLVLWAGRRAGALLVLALGIGALFFFNRQPELSVWAIYFFGSYALGAAAWWAGNPRRLKLWLGLIVCIVVAALIVDFRLRIVLALLIALLLSFGRRNGGLTRWGDLKALAWLGQVSYALFLVHFPILLLANAAFAHCAEAGEWTTVAMLGLSLLSSLGLAQLFYRHVESPAAQKQLIAASRQHLWAGIIRLRQLSSIRQPKRA